VERAVKRVGRAHRNNKEADDIQGDKDRGNHSRLDGEAYYLHTIHHMVSTQLFRECQTERALLIAVSVPENPVLRFDYNHGSGS
jgi:hypothetical protein